MKHWSRQVPEGGAWITSFRAAPTSRKIEIPFVVIAHFGTGSWPTSISTGMASVLVQVGLLAVESLPIAGAEVSTQKRAVRLCSVNGPRTKPNHGHKELDGPRKKLMRPFLFTPFCPRRSAGACGIEM
jgi:hypothetical protein